jgi:uncharacterized membrane protein
VGFLRFLASGVCAQRPDHTIAVGGQFLPLEARLGGLFVGFLIGMLYLFALGRDRAALLPGGATALVLLSGIAATCLDGLNAYCFDLGLPHIYTPTLTLRLASGLAAGFGVAAFSLPIIAASVWKEVHAEPSLDGLAELSVGYGLLSLAQLITQLDVAALFLPLAIVQGVAVVSATALVDLYLLALFLRRAGKAETWRALGRLGAAALLVALVKLAALAELRLYAESVLGVRWIA